MICLPTSLSQEVAAGLGAQAGEKKLREVITSGGFKSVRRATETPFNMIPEARLSGNSTRRSPPKRPTLRKDAEPWSGFASGTSRHSAAVRNLVATGG